MPRHDIARLRLSARHLSLLRALLAEHVPEAQVWAYGSRVTGHAHEGSDLDLVVRNPANLAAETPNWADLQDALRDSDLPMLMDSTTGRICPKPFTAISCETMWKYSRENFFAGAKCLGADEGQDARRGRQQKAEPACRYGSIEANLKALSYGG